jgi:hypothetical protein
MMNLGFRLRLMKMIFFSQPDKCNPLPSHGGLRNRTLWRRVAAL